MSAGHSCFDSSELVILSHRFFLGWLLFFAGTGVVVEHLWSLARVLGDPPGLHCERGPLRRGARLPAASPGLEALRILSRPSHFSRILFVVVLLVFLKGLTEEEEKVLAGLRPSC